MAFIISFLFTFLFGIALLIYGIGLLARAHLSKLSTAVGLFFLVSLFLFLLAG